MIDEEFHISHYSGLPFFTQDDLLFSNLDISFNFLVCYNPVAFLYGGCSSRVEHWTVAPGVGGSKPLIHPSIYKQHPSIFPRASQDPFYIKALIFNTATLESRSPISHPLRKSSNDDDRYQSR